MVNPALQSAIEAMSLDERLELLAYLESTVTPSEPGLTEESRAILRTRAQELAADPLLALSWEQVDALVGNHWK